MCFSRPFEKRSNVLNYKTRFTGALEKVQPGIKATHRILVRGQKFFASMGNLSHP